MPFCKECGSKLNEGSKFCEACGKQVTSSQNLPTQQISPQANPLKNTTPGIDYALKSAPMVAVIWIILFMLLSMFFILFIMLGIIGAKGQPSTIIPPTSKENASGSSVPIPKNLKTSNSKNSINLKWDAVETVGLKKYKIYKSTQSNKKFSLLKTVDTNMTEFTDKNVKRGLTYYYVVTAVTKTGAQSGNSIEASTVLNAQTIAAKGINFNSWADVKKYAKTHPKYFDLLKTTNSFTKDDVNRLVQKEKAGANFIRMLPKGSIITISTPSYKLIPNYLLTFNMYVLTDENDMPLVLYQFGNPIKLQAATTNLGTAIQKIQVFLVNIVVQLPPTVTNIVISLGEAANTVIQAITPRSIQEAAGPIVWGITPIYYVDPSGLGNLYNFAPEAQVNPTNDNTTQSVPASTPEPAKSPPPAEHLPAPVPKQQDELAVGLDSGPIIPSATMVITIHPYRSGVRVTYTINDTRGYQTSGSGVTGSNGCFYYSFPTANKDGDTGKVTVTAKAPDLGLEDSFQFNYY